MHVMNWAAAHEQGPDGAGGKGWNLGRLSRYGFPVPQGGVVSAEAYRLFLDHPDLREHVAALGPIKAADVASPEVTSALERLQERILATALPSAIAGQLHAFLVDSGLLDCPVAVRSSATAEDSAVASFAGIHQSFLNVTGLAAVVAALKGCYASLWTPQALAYRRKLGLPDEQVAAAVVILAMVPAKAAGVGFSCDPRTGRLDRFTISASWGLGEAVVSGAVEPDEFEVDVTQYPPVIVGRKIGSKAHTTVARAHGGTMLAESDQGAATRPALNDLQITELAYLIGRVSESLGAMVTPQDVEWAHDGSQFWLLQARPVTTLPLSTFPAVADQPVIWSNANLKDVMPGVQSTMGYSLFGAGIDQLLSAPFKEARYQYVGGITWVRLFEGRAYFNLTALQWAMYDALGLRPAEFNRILGGHQAEIPVPPPTLAQRARRALAQVRLMAKAMRVSRSIEGEFKRIWNWCEAAEADDRSGWTKNQFLRESLSVKSEIERFFPPFQIINGMAGSTHQELIKALEPAFGARAAAMANAMLAGASSATSAQLGERLVELGNLALKEEKTQAYFKDPDWAPAAWSEQLAGTQFKAGFQGYLHDFGHRGVYELEPMNPRWRDDPTYLLETIRGQVLSGREIHLQDQTHVREAATREVMSKLRWRPAVLKVRYMQKLSATSSAQREMAKSMVVKIAGVYRLAALALARCMVAEGLLEEPEDVFHLSWLDLEAYLLGRPGMSGLKALVADRRLQREIYMDREPPDIIIGDTPVKKEPLPEVSGPVMVGMGVSTGRARGICRVIHHPHEGTRLQPGDILVAPSTDPAWTPLFLRASAVVMEVGGYLSHGAIVAREYGLPAVVNIPGLLRTVKDGETLTVDGDEGKVYRGQ